MRDTMLGRLCPRTSREANSTSIPYPSSLLSNIHISPFPMPGENWAWELGENFLIPHPQYIIFSTGDGEAEVSRRESTDCSLVPSGMPTLPPRAQGAD